MSLMSWLIWSSSLATGSGVAGALAGAVAEPEGETERDGVSDSTVEAEGDELELAGGGVVGTGVALCLPQLATARATSSIAAATVAGRAGWRINFEESPCRRSIPGPIIVGSSHLSNNRGVSAV
jgi:hypothetical protein